MKEEKIIRFLRFAFIHIFDDEDTIVFFKDEKSDWIAEKIFWKFYFCVKW